MSRVEGPLTVHNSVVEVGDLILLEQVLIIQRHIGQAVERQRQGTRCEELHVVVGEGDQATETVGPVVLVHVQVFQGGEVQELALHDGRNGGVGVVGDQMVVAQAALDILGQAGDDVALLVVLHLDTEAILHGHVTLIDGIGDNASAQFIRKNFTDEVGFLGVENADLAVIIVQVRGQAEGVSGVLSLDVGTRRGGCLGFIVGGFVGLGAGDGTRQHESCQKQAQQFFHVRALLLIRSYWPSVADGPFISYYIIHIIHDSL